MQYIDTIPVFGEHEANTLEQAQQCVRILHTLTPLGVAMAGANEFDLYKD